MSKTDPLRANFRRWRKRRWLVELVGFEGVHADGSSIEDARRRLRKSLAWSRDWDKASAHAVSIEDTIEFPVPVRGAIDEYCAARVALAAATRRLDLATEVALSKLRSDLGLGLRDVATFLGLSHQRVHQIERAHSTAAPEEEGAGAAAE